MEKYIESVHEVTVPDISFEERIEAGKLTNGFPSLINEKNFHIWEKRERKVTIHLFHFDKDIFFGDAISVMEGTDVYHPKFRPTRTEELLALAADYPSLQLKYPILSAGDFTKFKTEVSDDVIIGNPLSPENAKNFAKSIGNQFDYVSPVLMCEMDKRFLGLFRLMSYCPSKMRFAAVSIEDDKKWKEKRDSASSPFLKSFSIYDIFPSLRKEFQNPT